MSHFHPNPMPLQPLTRAKGIIGNNLPSKLKEKVKTKMSKSNNY